MDWVKHIFSIFYLEADFKMTETQMSPEEAAKHITSWIFGHTVQHNPNFVRETLKIIQAQRDAAVAEAAVWCGCGDQIVNDGADVLCWVCAGNLRQQLQAELDAQAAAMRVALGTAISIIKTNTFNPSHIEDGSILWQLENALANDAGKELLEVVEAAKEFIEILEGPMNSILQTGAVLKLKITLKALQGKVEFNGKI